MKRSKVFLGLTTCLLAVAAFAASKRNPLTVCIITGQGQSHLVQTNAQLSGTNTKFVTTSPGNTWTARTADHCIVKVHTGA